VVLTQGVALQGELDPQAADRDEFPQLADRFRQHNGNDDDDQ
jgi:hypothetical protein